MERLKQLKTYPFSLFLWLEWIFLGSLILGYLPQSYVTGEYRIPSESIKLVFAMSLFCILVLGAMGLKLPQKNSLHKWIYFLVQLTLVCVPCILTKEISYSIYACL